MSRGPSSARPASARVRCLALAVALGGPALGGLGEEVRLVTAVPDEVREALFLDPAYTKLVDADGLPVLAVERVADQALLEAAWLVDRMLAGRDDLRAEMVRNGTRVVVQAHDQWTTQVPEYADLHPADYWDRRARGLGPTLSRPVMSCAEENLLGYPGDPYSTESIFVHEFAHAIHQMALETRGPEFDAKLGRAYEAALGAGLWAGKYAASNTHEYWAEGVQSWFGTNREDDHDHNHVNTRAELVEYDPALGALIAETFPERGWQYVHPGRRAKGAAGTAHLAGYEPGAAPSFAWPRELVERYEAHRGRELVRRRRPGEDRVAWLYRTAIAGDPAAQVRLGWHYREGEAVEQDDVRAVAWYRAAAEQGDADGRDNLGWMLSEGRGAERDDVEAVRLFELSARQGHSQGQLNLARMLRAGRGVERADPVEAWAWLRVAAGRGHGGAARTLRELSTELSPEERERAERRAAELSADL